MTATALPAAPLSSDGFVEVGGDRLEYRHFGPTPGSAPNLILLHEGLGCVAMWRDFPERLAAATGWGVFVYSRAGYGRSSSCRVPRPLTYMHEEAQEVLPELLDRIGFCEGVLLGHSDGASIAAIHAGHFQDPRVRGLILMAPHFFTEDMGIRSIAEAKTGYQATDLRDRLARYHGDNVDCAFWGWNRAWLDPDFRKWDIREFLPGIVVPSLILQGEDDQYGTTLQVEAARSLSGGPVEAVVLPDCQHAPFKEQPEKALAAIMGFLQRVERSLEEEKQ